jgi:hypothetical protein
MTRAAAARRPQDRRSKRAPTSAPVTAQTRVGLTERGRAALRSSVHQLTPLELEVAGRVDVAIERALAKLERIAVALERTAASSESQQARADEVLAFVRARAEECLSKLGLGSPDVGLDDYLGRRN